MMFRRNDLISKITPSNIKKLNSIFDISAKIVNQQCNADPNIFHLTDEVNTSKYSTKI